MSGEWPVGARSGSLLFPAIAIPVVKKKSFECPKEHIETMIGILPSITKILIVGWKAKEEHFLQLLKNNLPKKVDIFTICGSQREAVATCESITNGGVTGMASYSDHGLSSCLRTDEIDKFLNHRRQTVPQIVP